MTSSSNKAVFFRLDFGGLIGRGHLSRCLNVAEALKKLNVESVFIIRSRDKLTKNLSIPHKVIWLKETKKEISSDVTTWLTDTEEDEIHDLSFIVPSPSILFLDHYGFSLHAHQLLKKLGHTLILFNDDEGKKVVGDLIINYNLDTNDLPSNDRCLHGTQYAPLNHRFAEERKNLKNLIHKAEIGVYLGGIEFSIFKMFAEALIENAKKFNTTLLWICSTKKELEFLDRSFAYENLKILINLPHLLDVYKKSYFFIGTCGVAFLERACLGIPQLVFLTADNQKKIANAVVEKQLAFFGGDLRLCSEDSLHSTLKKMFLLDENEYILRVRNALDLTDGQGADRLARRVFNEIKQ